MNGKWRMRCAVAVLICMQILMDTSSGLGAVQAADIVGKELSDVKGIVMESVELKVGSEKEWKNAIFQINKAEDGEFTIRLTADISITYESSWVDEKTSFMKNTTTILGGGHTITLRERGCIAIAGSATVNFGSEEVSDILNITQSTQDQPAEAAILALGGTTNMYDGVRVFECKPVPGTMSSAVRISKGPDGTYGTFHMYGGSIDSNTMAESSFGGGAVIVEPGCEFYMHGGIIENNKTVDMEFGFPMSGGVTVFGGAFYMDGGTIQNNTCEKGLISSDYTAGGAKAMRTLWMEQS